MSGHSRRSRVRGFALPLAVCVLVTVTLVIALVLDGAIATFRSARADLEFARAEAAAESALTTVLGTRLDTAALAAPAGSTLWESSLAGPDSVTATMQALGAKIVRIVVRAKLRAGSLRVSAGRVVFAQLRADSIVPGELRLTPLRGPWWAPIP